MDIISYGNVGRLAENYKLPTRTDHLKEQTRQRIVNLVFIIYWLLIFEGALRKWVFPDAFQALYFIRDPFVLVVYFLAIPRLRSLSSKRLLGSWMLLGLVAAAIGIGQVAYGDTDLVTLAYGWRNLFFYIPLAFVIGANLREADLQRLIRQTLLVAIPISALVVLQFNSSAGAIVNQGLIEGGLAQPGLVGNLVRTYGTFTSSSGQTPFVVSSVAMLLAAWVSPGPQHPLKGIYLLVATGAVLSNLVLSGSRGALIWSATVISLALVGSRILPRVRVRTTLFLLVFSISSILILPFALPRAYEAVTARFIDASEAESQLYTYGTLGRPFAGVTDVLELLPEVPLTGYGMGRFGNAYVVEASSSLLKRITILEEEWSRNVAELGPVMGLLYIGFRICLVISLGKAAIVATRRTGNLLFILLFGFTSIILFNGQISAHGSVNGYGWLFGGFCIAANRLHLSGILNPSN